MAPQRRPFEDLIRLERENDLIEHGLLRRTSQTGANGGRNPNGNGGAASNGSGASALCPQCAAKAAKNADGNPNGNSHSNTGAAGNPSAFVSKQTLGFGARGDDDETPPGGRTEREAPAANASATAGADTCPTCGGAGTIAAKTTFPRGEEAIEPSVERTTARTLEGETEAFVETPLGRALTPDDILDALARLRRFFGNLWSGVKGGAIRITPSDGGIRIDLPGFFAFPEVSGRQEGGGDGKGTASQEPENGGVPVETEGRLRTGFIASDGRRDCLVAGVVAMYHEWNRLTDYSPLPTGWVDCALQAIGVHAQHGGECATLAVAVIDGCWKERNNPLKNVLVKICAGAYAECLERARKK
ncbi:MAG: hypothetical protein HY719_02020 [Planctomycetes bacterium]|nr:hypothetical protein [Planctomycetota bacterium]